MSLRPVLVAPSILASDFSCLGDQVSRMEAAGADWIHCDVMDGHFVDNISFGPAFVEAAARRTRLPMDVHLMISRPDHYWERFVPHARSLSVHVEAEHDVGATLGAIRAAGLLAGLALSPATDFASVEPYAGLFDLLLVMTVVPGFGGQPFLPGMLGKVRAGRALRARCGREFRIEVDGGITVESAALCREAGADTLVAGTAVFGAADPAREIRCLRGEGDILPNEAPSPAGR